MKDKYVWWGILGIGVAAFFWFLTKQQISSQSQNVPYLVPAPLNNQGTTGGFPNTSIPLTNTSTDISSPTTGNSISEQQNIVGEHQNSTQPNGSNSIFLSSPISNLQTPSAQTANQPVGA